MPSARSRFKPGTSNNYCRRQTSCILGDVPADKDADNENLARSPTLATPPRGVAIADTVHPNAGAPARDTPPSLPGFRIAGLIGRGGMGEVVCGHDIEIGRDVAIKRLR